MRVDVHAHLWSAEYLDLLESHGEHVYRVPGAGNTESEVQGRLALMDSAGVDLQVLSAAPQLGYSHDEGRAVAAATQANHLHAGVVAAHTGRFAAFATLPLPYVGAALAELGRAMDELGMAGATIATEVLGRSIADPEFEPIYAELDRRGGVLFVHSAGCGAGSKLITSHNLTWLIGAPIEDTVALGQMITRGLPSRFPRLRIVHSHLGGALPMLIQRMDNLYPIESPETPELPSLAAKRMWYDTVGHGHVPALRCACESLGADRLMLGSDFPFASGEGYRRAVSYIEDLKLAEEEVRAIHGETAVALLGLANVDRV